MDFEELKEFGKDQKKLVKKYRSIPEDLETVKQVLAIMPDERPPFSYRINNLGIRTCICLLYTSPSPRDGLLSRMPSSA